MPKPIVVVSPALYFVLLRRIGRFLHPRYRTNYYISSMIIPLVNPAPDPPLRRCGVWKVLFRCCFLLFSLSSSIPSSSLYPTAARDRKRSKTYIGGRGRPLCSTWYEQEGRKWEKFFPKSLPDRRCRRAIRYIGTTGEILGN